MEKKIRITFCISEREKEVLDACIKSRGKSMSEIIRGLIDEEYDKLYPPYKASSLGAKRIPKDELTDEQKCELKGGVVGLRNGIRVCIKSVGPSASRSVPLDSIDKFKDF